MDLTRMVRMLVAAAVFGIAVTPVFAAPARACSCAGPADIQAWVDESEAAFVGTLVDKRHTPDLQAIYVFEVEEWVKGDLGEVIEVHSAADGGACGFEFWDPDQRIGAIIHEENGELHGGLCSQIDPDVLLTVARGMTPSATGIGRLLVGNGWSSSRLSVLDDVGGHVADLSPPVARQEAGTQLLEACPGGDLMLQVLPLEIIVWDLATLEVVAKHDVSDLERDGWVTDAACRTPDASSMFLLVSDDVDSKLIEVVPELKPVMDLEGISGDIGTDFVISQANHEGDATWVDMSTGARTALTETPPNDLRSISVATHPTDRLVAVVETDFNENGPTVATLSIIDETGEPLQRFDIPGETYSPTWLDGSRVAVKTYDHGNWEQSFGFVFDLDNGEMVEIEGWDAEYTVARGDRLYGVSGSDIVTTDLSARTVRTLATLPSQSAGPLIVLDQSQPIAPTTTVPPEPQAEPTVATTPPLLAPEPGIDDPDSGSAARWIAGGAIVGFVGLLLWLARPQSGRKT